MSIAKRLLEEKEHKKNIAESIALKGGALRRCEYCDDVANNQDDEGRTRAFMIANKLISENNPKVSIFKGDRRALTDLIDAVIVDSNWDCHCEEVSKS